MKTFMAGKLFHTCRLKFKIMNLTKSSNPILKDKVFAKGYTQSDEVMTVNGTVNKTALNAFVGTCWRGFYMGEVF